MTKTRWRFGLLAFAYICFWAAICAYGAYQHSKAEDGFSATVEKAMAEAEPDEGGWVRVSSSSTPELLIWDKKTRAALDLMLLALICGIAAPVASGIAALCWWICRRILLRLKSLNVGYRDPF